jgi:hypothetical protein
MRFGKDTIRFLNVVAAILVVCGSACARSAREPNAPRASRNSQHGPRLSRGCEYWRAPERTPGTLVCPQPVARNVWVSCDRWPDGSDLRRFGLDAIRLCNAKTDHERCLAVYRWIRRWMICPDGRVGAPTEKIASRDRKNGFVDHGLKQLNVYGVHWCDGQVRILEGVWRALGYRAEKVVCGGHTIAGCGYKDYDGVDRWHALDVSHSGLLFDRSRRRLLSLDDLATEYYGGHYQWVFCPHNDWDDHRMELSLRVGEKIERIWGNWHQPYEDNVARRDRKVPDWERGPYPLDHGNGRWTYSPDLTRKDWSQGLAEPPLNMAPDELRPAEAGKPATAVWDFRTPYIIADASVTLRLVRKSVDDQIRLHLSVDDGATWSKAWECPADVTGETSLSVPIGDKFVVTDRAEPPKQFPSPFGRYAYRLKLELRPRHEAHDCRVQGIRFDTVVQQNYFALPQLQPGKNLINVRGDLAPDEALKITYVWDDPLGEGRRNVTVVEKTPYTYEIQAAGGSWQACKCKSVTIEGIRATHQGNHTLAKEAASRLCPSLPMRPVEETARGWYQPLRKELATMDKVLAGLGRPGNPTVCICAATMNADARAFPQVAKIVRETANSEIKNRAMVALYVIDRDKARPILFEVASEKDRSNWDTSKDPIGEAPWVAGTAVIGLMAADARWNEFLPLLVRALKNPTAWPGWGPRAALIRAIGRLGRDNSEAALAVRAVLTDELRKEDDDSRAVAALAAGQICNSALVPALRRHLDSAYQPLQQNAALSLSLIGDKQVAPLVRPWLRVADDENFRAVAAEVLKNRGDAESLAPLREAAAVEPFPWVREKLERATRAIEASGKSAIGDCPNFCVSKNGTVPFPRRHRPDGVIDTKLRTGPPS